MRQTGWIVAAFVVATLIGLAIRQAIINQQHPKCYSYGVVYGRTISGDVIPNTVCLEEDGRIKR